MMKPWLLPIACLGILSTLSAQQIPFPRFTKDWDVLDGVFLPEELREKVMRSTPGFDPAHDYGPDAAAVLDGNPDAPLLCAALLISRPMRQMDQGMALRQKETELCKAHQPTPEQLENVRLTLYPPPPPRRQQIASQLGPYDQFNRRYIEGVYMPEPADPLDWFHGDIPGRDYRADLQAAFDRDPLIAARACAYSNNEPSSNPRVTQLRSIQRQVCDAFPDAKIEAAFAAKKSEDARNWLSGLMNSMLDEAAAMSPDARRGRGEDIAASIAGALGGQSRFQNTLRLLALAPADWRGPAMALRYASEAGMGSPGARESDVKQFLTDLYESRMKLREDSLNWRRGARAYFALIGQLDRAHSIAQDILRRSDRDLLPRDKIYLATIDRILGNRAPYDALLANCPAPDPVYLQQRGRPSRPEQYCETVIAPFVTELRGQLRGHAAYEEVAKIAAETNRTIPADAVIATVAAPPPHQRTPKEVTDDWFAQIIKTQSDRVAPMTSVQRNEVADDIRPSFGIGEMPFEEAVYLMFVAPWRENAVAAVFGAAGTQGFSPGFDKAQYLRKRLTEYYESRAASGPDSAEWRRGFRVVLLFNGDYERSLQLSRELVKEHHPIFGVRDTVLLGLSERIAGNRKPLDQAIAKCPGEPQDMIERWGRSSDPTIYCRMIALWDISRSTYLAPRRTLPHAYTEFLQESARACQCPDMRTFSIEALQRIDLGLADKEWQDLLVRQDVTPYDQLHAFWGLAGIAEQQKRWTDGLHWIDKYLEVGVRPFPFDPSLWGVLASLPEAKSPMRNEILEAYDARFRLSIGAHDLEETRRTLEGLLALTQCGPGCGDAFVWSTRFHLIKLAEAEIDAGQRQEPLRILGYVARNPLDAQLTALIDEIRKKLGNGSQPVEPKREETPWDSPPRRPRPTPQEKPKIST